MKVCVFGAGAIGGHLAGRLFKGGSAPDDAAKPDETKGGDAS